MPRARFGIGAISSKILHANAAPDTTRATPLAAFRVRSTVGLTDGRVQCSLDEPAFFTSATHRPLRLAEIEQKADRLAKILPLVNGPA